MPPSEELSDSPCALGSLGSPSPRFAESRESCPVSKFRLPGGDTIDENRIRDFPSSMSVLNPPEHTRIRSLMEPSFAPERIERWRPDIQEIALHLLETMRARGCSIDLVATFCLELPVRVVCRVLGVRADQMPKFRHWTEATMSTTSMPVEERGARTEAFLAYVEELVESRHDDPGDGLIDELIAARGEDGSRLSDKELVGSVISVIVAGYETTTTVLACGALTLLRHPKALAELRADPGLWPQAVEEVLRYDAPMTDDAMLQSGTEIAAGTAATSADGDLRWFRDRGRFDIRRPDNHHLAFGQGPHSCLGAALARLEMQVGFAALFTGLPGLRLAVPAGELEWTSGARMSALKSLPVRWGAVH